MSVTERAAGPPSGDGYEDDTVRRFVVAALGWGSAGVVAGMVSAGQLLSRQLEVWPALAHARLSSLPFNALVFAFVGNTVFAGITHATQRLLATPWGAPWLSRYHFWAFQGFLLAATLLLPWGASVAEPRPRLTLVLSGVLGLTWALFGAGLLLTVTRRRVVALPVAV